MLNTIISGAGVQALVDPELDPLFRVPARFGVPSAWWEHVPFAMLLVTQMRPGTVVELGTHFGVSFAAFCDAMQRGAIPGRCYAVDTWQGDHQAGFYGEEVFRDLSAFIAMRYKHCGELIRVRFDDALEHFADGSIDILHIDGLHTYEAVKHDFESWKPKLSERGVVLFHDTNVRWDDFGVHRLWAEIREKYPSFEFLHGYGLGVLAVGPDHDPFVASLCNLDSQSTHTVRERIAWLGARWTSACRERQLAEMSAELERVRSAFAAQGAQLSQVHSSHAEQSAELDRVRSALAAQVAELNQAHSSQAEQSVELDRARADASQRAVAHAAELDRANVLLAEATNEMNAARSKVLTQDADLLRALETIAERDAAIADVRTTISEQERRVAELEQALSRSAVDLAINQEHITNFQAITAEYDQALRNALRRDVVRRFTRLFRRKRTVA